MRRTMLEVKMVFVKVTRMKMKMMIITITMK